MLSDGSRVLNVLVVDDDSALLRTMRDILSMHGCRPETASTGQEGLVLARRNTPAVALVDLRLPDMDGLELVSQLKAASGSTEVIILTGNASLQSAVQAMRKQSFDYLIKPVRPDDLFRSLDRAGERFFRRQAEEALRNSEEQLRRVFSAVNDGLLIVDESNRVVQLNAAAARIVGLPPDELMDMEADELFGSLTPVHSAGDGATANIREGKLRGGRGGEERNVEVSATGFAPGRLVYTIRDVTEQRSMQERLRVAQKMEALGRLAGGVAHDFNNVLTAIRGYADLVREELGGEHPLSPDVEEIRKAADRAGGLTRQLLAFSRRQVLQPRCLDLGELLLEMEGMLTRLVREDIVLRIRAEKCAVVADPGQIEQIFLNLVVNARDAMPEGGEILVEAGAEAGSDAAGPELLAFIRVSDSGVGIPEDVLPHIFEPFFTTKELGKGTGFGLSTIHGIVHQLGGTIDVESNPGATRITVRLPVAEAPEGMLPEPASHPVRGSEDGGSVLLVEDDSAIRRLMKRSLADRGFVVHAAGTAAEALRLLDSTETLDLLITDLVLPDLSGWEVARLVTEVRPEIRVLYMSGYAEEVGEYGSMVIAPGTSFIPKPFTANELLDKIRAILDGEEPAQPH